MTFWHTVNLTISVTYGPKFGGYRKRGGCFTEPMQSYGVTTRKNELGGCLVDRVNVIEVPLH